MEVRGIKGIIVPIVTPMNESGGIDAAGTRKVLSHVVDGGVAGVFALGSTGEFSSLTLAQRIDFVRLAAAELKNKVPLMVGITSPCEAETIELMHAAHAAGASAIVALAPYYFPFSNQETLAEYFENLAGTSPLPLFLYNNTGYGKPSPLTVKTVVRLAKHPNILGIKEVTGFTNLMAMVAATAGGKPFSVLAADDFQMTPHVCFGAHGGINSLANVAPRLYVEACRLAMERNLPALGDVTEQGSYAQRVLALHELYQVQPNAISAIKGAMSVLGLCGTAVANPLQPIAPESVPEIRSILKRAGV